MMKLGCLKSYLGLGIHLCCVLQQELSDFTVSCSGGHVEGSFHFLVEINVDNSIYIYTVTVEMSVFAEHLVVHTIQYVHVKTYLILLIHIKTNGSDQVLNFSIQK